MSYLSYRILPMLLALGLSVSFALPADAISVRPGEPAPNFTLKSIDGTRVALDQFKGKTVVIAFWSTWCARCEEELAFLRDRFGAREDVVVLLVNQDGEKGAVMAKVRGLRDKLDIRFPILLDEELKTWDGYGINALPTSVVVDKDGSIKHVEPNFYWASPDKLIEAVGQG